MMQGISTLPRSPRPLLRPAFWRLSPSHFCRALATQVSNNGYGLDQLLSEFWEDWSYYHDQDNDNFDLSFGKTGQQMKFGRESGSATRERRSRWSRLSSSLAYSSRLLSWFKDYHIYWGVDGWDDYYPNYDDYDYDWSRLAMREVLWWATCSIAPGGNLRVTAAPGVSEVFSFRWLTIVLKWVLTWQHVWRGECFRS